MHVCGFMNCCELEKKKKMKKFKAKHFEMNSGQNKINLTASVMKQLEGDSVHGFCCFAQSVQ